MTALNGNKRKYQDLWELIKTNGFAQVSAAKSHHSTIKKGVIKEKDQDIGYKLLLSEEHQKAVLKVSYSGVVITFTLKKFKQHSLEALN